MSTSSSIILTILDFVILINTNLINFVSTNNNLFGLKPFWFNSWYDWKYDKVNDKKLVLKPWFCSNDKTYKREVS
jgi:hypothetical protein